LLSGSWIRWREAPDRPSPAEVPNTEEDATMRAKDIMSHPAVTCPVTSTLDQAARIMWECDCGIVPVVDNEGRLAGVVTDRDICMAAYTQGRPIREIPVVTAMAREVAASHTEDTIESVESLMREMRVRRIPVIDTDNRVAGLISLNDLARQTSRARRAAADRELVQTMAAVCQPRQHAPHAPAPTAAPVLAL
jgi:CBS domain-containing protein